MAVYGVNHYAWRAGCADQIEPGMAIDAGVQQPVNLTAQQMINQIVLALAVVTGVTQQQYPTVAESLSLQRLGQGGKKRVGDIGYHQPVGQGVA
ncbi:hypothetical protein D3C87_1998050 [compost metagenome]